jgi:hypothetical protein
MYVLKTSSTAEFTLAMIVFHPRWSNHQLNAKKDLCNSKSPNPVSSLNRICCTAGEPPLDSGASARIDAT